MPPDLPLLPSSVPDVTFSLFSEGCLAQSVATPLFEQQKNCRVQVSNYHLTICRGHLHLTSDHNTFSQQEVSRINMLILHAWLAWHYQVTRIWSQHLGTWSPYSTWYSCFLPFTRWYTVHLHLSPCCFCSAPQGGRTGYCLTYSKPRVVWNYHYYYYFSRTHFVHQLLWGVGHEKL